MTIVPKAFENLIEAFQRLPGIGPRSSQRLAYHVLKLPEYEINALADALKRSKTDISLCVRCKNISEGALCPICSDESRDVNKIIVISNPSDILPLLKTGFKGTFHVIHGLIDPLNHIDPEQLYINTLIERVNDLSMTDDDKVIEIILGTNTSMEGETTAMYIHKALLDLQLPEGKLIVTRIARGLPMGGDIEYADETTLFQALEGRLRF